MAATALIGCSGWQMLYKKPVSPTLSCTSHSPRQAKPRSCRVSQGPHVDEELRSSAAGHFHTHLNRCSNSRPPVSSRPDLVRPGGALPPSLLPYEHRTLTKAQHLAGRGVSIENIFQVDATWGELFPPFPPLSPPVACGETRKKQRQGRRNFGLGVEQLFGA